MHHLTWFGWVMLVIELISIIVTISYIERPRPPLSLQVALISIAMTGFFMWGMIWIGTTT